MVISRSSLNHTYRTVWNESLGAMVAVAELAPARGKSSQGVKGARCKGAVLSQLPRLALAALAVASVWCAGTQMAAANPSGAVAIQGQASLTSNGNQLLVTTQNGVGTNHSAINWQSFSIPTGSGTYFLQPNVNSTSINRVVSNAPSLIFGTLGSNGKLVLVNQSGITVGAGAVVDTAGFTASALRMTDADAIAGRLRFGDASVPAGDVSVQGSVLARSGDVVLLGANVLAGSNALVQAPNGNTILAAGQSVEITARGLEGISLLVQAPSNAAVNLGTLTGDAVGIFAGTLTHSGSIQANAVTTVGGRVLLQAVQQADVSGTVSAAGMNGSDGGRIDIAVAHSSDAANPGVLIQTGALNASGSTGAGGAVHLSADAMLLSGAISADGASGGGQVVVQALNQATSTTGAVYSASSSGGAGGTVLVDGGTSNYTSGRYSATGVTGGNVTLAGQNIELAATQVDASGTQGGGTIHVGGLMHGAAGFGAAGVSLNNADNVYSNSAASLKADAVSTGNGGEIVMWAQQAMRAAGTLSAQGGAASGDGGQAEVSGLQSMGYRANVNLSAAHGAAGTLLMDPKNITVVAGYGGWTGLGSSYQEILDPTPGAGEGFGGYGNLVMSNGAIVVPSPNDSTLGTNRGAVYFFSSTGALNAALVGAANNDQISSGGLISLAGDKLLVISPVFGNAGNVSNSLGAVTWANGQTGALSTGTLGGTVSASNSLVGFSAGDEIGTGLHSVLANGNVLINSPQWGGGPAGTSATIRGAITWINGATGALSDGTTGGALSAANSLVGATAGDQVGLYNAAVELTSGNVLLASPNWIYVDPLNGAQAASAGAVTWMNGATGHLANGAAGGVIGASNSLVGQVVNSYVGTPSALPNGNGLVISSQWSGTAASPVANAGAVTWINGSNGTFSDGLSYGGFVSAANSLVGSSVGDAVGNYSNFGYQYNPVTHNVVVLSPYWSNGGTTPNAGAITVINGATGMLGGAYGGVVSSANSWISDQSGALLGYSPVTDLLNGKLAVRTPTWNGGYGAVLWLDTAVSGYGGVVGPSNSLVGTSPTDGVGLGLVQSLSGSNYVVLSSFAGNGAITWVNGGTGLTVDGTRSISSANSLLGGALDATGYSVPNYVHDSGTGNYNFVFTNSQWGGGKGAVTWMNASNGSLAGGSYGVITPLNSLVGATPTGPTPGDQVGSGGVVPGIGNSYMVVSPLWNNGGLAGAGAVTLGSAATGAVGVVGVGNSLVGSAAGDAVGSGTVTAVSASAFVVSSPGWQSGGLAGQGYGAMTFINTASPTVGPVSNLNSLVGAAAGDQVGSGGIILSVTGNLLIRSPLFGNGGTPANALGAVTWMNGSTGALVGGTSYGGVVSSTNSLVGAQAGDQIGSGGVIASGLGTNYVVLSSLWNNGGTASNAMGAVTLGNGTSGTVGAVGSGNSLVGAAAGDAVGSGGIAITNGGNSFVVSSPQWGSTGASGQGLGAVTYVNTAAPTGTVSTANSLVGAAAGDQVGSGGFTYLNNGNLLIHSPSYGNGGSAPNAGAVTWMSGSTGRLADTTMSGTVSAVNSLVGSTTGDQVGGAAPCDCSYSGGVVALSDGNYVVNSPHWQISLGNPSGAVTWGNGTTGLVGTISSANSALVALNYSPAEAPTGKVLVGSTAANGGAGGLYLVGPSSGGNPFFATAAGSDATVGAVFLASTLSNGSNVLMQASNDITINADIIASPATNSPGTTLTMQAGRSIAINANINTNSGNVTLIANDTAADGVVSANRDAGAANLTQSVGTITTLGRVSLQLLNGAGNTNNTVGTITQAPAASIAASNLDVITYGGASLTGANSVGTLQLVNTGSAASVFNNASALVLGDFTGLGVQGGSGSVKVSAAGNLSILGGGYGGVTSSAAGDAVVLATTGNFTDGGVSISTPSGNWLVYSTDPTLNSVTGVTNVLHAGDFKQFGATTSTAPAQTTGNGFLYSVPELVTFTLTGAPTKIYDGTTQVALTAANFVSANSLGSTDVFTAAAQTGNFNAKDVAAARTVSATGMTVTAATEVSTGANVYGYQVSGTATGVGTITPATVTLSATKVYDGTTSLTGAVTVTGLIGTETLSYTGATASDSHVATAGKSITAITLGNGTGLASDYVLAPLSSSTAPVVIQPLAAATWNPAVSSGLWSATSSWTNGLVPLTTDVLSAVIPANTVVTFDASAQNTSLQSLTSAGTVNVTGGSLTVSSALSTANYQQSGGSVSGAGSFTVSNSFAQTGGTVAMTGPVAITQGIGNLVVGSVSGSSVSLNAPTGAISQTAPVLTPGLLTANAASGVTLTDVGNSAAQFSATISGPGTVTFVNNGVLDVTGITVGQGDVMLDNTGAFSNSGAINVAQGAVDIAAHSPMTIGAGISASGNILLTALTNSTNSNIVVNGNVVSTAGGITVQAFNNYVQNARLNAALGINVTAGGTITFGPNAFSVGNPVNYTANGVALTPPWVIAALTGGPSSFVTDFLNQFQTALDAQLYAADDPLGKQLSGGGVVVEGNICTP